MRELRDSVTPIIANVKAEVDDAIGLSEATSVAPLPGQRALARSYLRGMLVLGEMMSAESQVGDLDRGTSATYAAATAAQRHVARLCDPMQAPRFLAQGEPAILELDAQEARAWREFARRIRAVAAED
jgi:hypothetical protein